MRLKFLFPILFIYQSTAAQDTTYFNLQYKKVSADSADTYEIRTKNDALQTRKIEIYHFKPLYKISEEIYDNTKDYPTLHGTQISYYTNGQVHHSANYLQGILDGEMVVYYQNGKIRRQEQYKKGNLQSSLMYDSLGVTMPVCGEWEKNATFNGGNKALYQYLTENIKMPAGVIALKGKYAEKVFVKFKIDPKGLVKDIVVLKSNREDTAEEAIRLVKSMPNWTPAEKDCELVETTYVLPISFVVK